MLLAAQPTTTSKGHHMPSNTATPAAPTQAMRSALAHPMAARCFAYMATAAGKAHGALTPSQWATYAGAVQPRNGYALRNVLRTCGARVQAGSNGTVVPGTSGRWPAYTAAQWATFVGYAKGGTPAQVAKQAQQQQAHVGKVAKLRSAASSGARAAKRSRPTPPATAPAPAPANAAPSAPAGS